MHFNEFGNINALDILPTASVPFAHVPQVLAEIKMIAKTYHCVCGYK